MAALYPGTSVSGYNANPPPDDGTSVSTNLIAWNTDVKAKIGDPLNTFAGSVDTNITNAFGKTLDGSSVVSSGISYTITSADQGRLIVMTGSGTTVVAPTASSVGAPFIFAVNNQSAGTVGIAPSTGTIDGLSQVIVQSGGSCLVKTDGTNWFTVGFKPGANSLSSNNYGFGSAVNASLSISVGSGILTVALKDVNGNNASASDPIMVPFNPGTGAPTWVSVTGPLSMTTNAIGATLGVANGVPFRLWVLLINNGSTPSLALWHSGVGSSSPVINALNENQFINTVGISAGATSAGVFYTPNGTAITGAAYRILGYMDWPSGLATAGNYTSLPTNGYMFGPGQKKPGDIIQVITGTNQTAATVSSSTYAAMASAPTPAIIPSAATSLIELELSSTLDTPGGANSNVSWSRGTSANTNIIGTASFINVAGGFPLHLRAFDVPGTTSSQTYTIQARAAGGALVTVNIQTVTSQQVWTLKEYCA